jgi:D-alanyl-lipoteichoic acid acyltransferase DltB (MBOAT superfamily)
MIGLVKKCIFADYLAQYNDLVFGNPGAYSGPETLFAVYGYAIQIYCDFSGYTDMAIGMGKMMGFDLGINFNKPYQSTSLTDFWRRWHISLSSWLRDYLYIPLGGNRKGKIRTHINLLITMLLGGLWHGANWKFIFWGGMHGLGLVIDKLWRKITKGRLSENRIAKVLGWFITLHFVVALWVFFRADSFQTAVQILQQIFTPSSWPLILTFLQTRMLFVVLLIAAIAIHAVPSTRFSKIEDAYIRTPFIVKAVAFVVLVQVIIQIQGTDVQPFIYFQF